MILLILELALIILILITILCTLNNSDTTEIDINVIRPWKFSIIIKKKNSSKC